MHTRRWSNEQCSAFDCRCLCLLARGCLRAGNRLSDEGQAVSSIGLPAKSIRLPFPSLSVQWVCAATAAAVAIEWECTRVPCLHSLRCCRVTGCMEPTSPSWTPSHSRSPAAFPAAAADPHHSPTAISLIQRVHTHTNHTTHSQPQSTCRNSPQVRPCSCRPPPPAALLLRSFPRRTRPHRMHLLMLELHFRALCRRLVSSQAAFAACTRRLRRSS